MTSTKEILDGNLNLMTKAINEMIDNDSQTKELVKMLLNNYGFSYLKTLYKYEIIGEKINRLYYLACNGDNKIFDLTIKMLSTGIFPIEEISDNLSKEKPKSFVKLSVNPLNNFKVPFSEFCNSQAEQYYMKPSINKIK